jgi:DNA mismatch repair protein MutS2
MTINLIMTQNSIHHKQIEWDILSKIIADYAYFESNKEILISKNFGLQLDRLMEELIRTQSYIQSLKDEQRQLIKHLLDKLPQDRSLQKFRDHIIRKGILNFSELNKVAILIESGAFLKSELSQINIAELNQLKELDFNPINRRLLREFRHLVDSNGELHLDRHPELAELYRKLRELEDRIRRSIQEWINDPNNNKVLQYSSYDVHYERYVVPIRSDSYRSEFGLIVSRSESGQTLFIEPFEVRDACNRRLELIAKIDEIINQLAMKFSHLFHEFSELIQTTHRELLQLDYFLAKSSFAIDYNLNCPQLRNEPGFRFTQLSHPLIRNAVKNSADCSKKDHGIVISGPNTGGKTVFLKSIALSYMLFYHGFFVPALEAEMYPYEGLFYFGNDLQDLKIGLSSFSGEVKSYIELLEHLLSSNLVLIDEIFNSTSSDEASALSLAYFEELHQRGQCHIIVSTHHQMFKTLVHQDRHYISCHVGFDTKNMKPTYKVQWGTPGASMALDIFKILSKGHHEVSRIPEKAQVYLGSKNISYETLLQRVSQKQIELDQLLSNNRQLEIELKNQKGAMEGVLKLKLQEELNKARKEVDRILEEAKTIVEEAKRNEITKLKRVDEKSFQLKNQLRQIHGETEEIVETSEIQGGLSINDLKLGDTVYSLVLKKEFSVFGIDPRKLEVSVGKGPIKINVPLHTLTASKKSALKSKVSVSFQRNNNAHLEYDVRGMRLSEFQSIIDKALGDLLAGDIPYISVIHGHGDGILKNWLRDYLKKSKEFNWGIPENGNDGETKITLK